MFCGSGLFSVTDVETWPSYGAYSSCAKVTAYNTDIRLSSIHQRYCAVTINNGNDTLTGMAFGICRGITFTPTIVHGRSLEMYTKFNHSSLLKMVAFFALPTSIYRKSCSFRSRLILYGTIVKNRFSNLKKAECVIQGHQPG